MKSTKTIGIVFLLLISASVLGCTGKEKPADTVVPVTTTVAGTLTEETLIYTFNVGDTKIMFDKSITLLAFDIEDSYAVLDIDGMRYDDVGLEMDENIGGRTIKVFDVDDSSQTAKISVK